MAQALLHTRTCEHKAQALLGGLAAVNGVNVLKVVRKVEREVAHLGALLGFADHLSDLGHDLVRSVCGHFLIVITAAGARMSKQDEHGHGTGTPPAVPAVRTPNGTDTKTPRTNAWPWCV